MKPTPKTPPPGDGLQGEGNHDAARRHRASAEKFVRSGAVEPAAREAAPHNVDEAREMRDAERAGQSPARR